MNSRLFCLLVIALVSSWPLAAQSQSPSPNSSLTKITPPVSDSDSSAVILPPSQLQQLVAPIALYSDPLLALILPASTFPNDITKADDYLNNGGSQDGIDAQDWDNSVKGVAHYPDILHMMATNLDWMNQLGAAVLAQESAVLAAVQAQRAKAKSLGNLVSTPQQQVVTENGAIQISPANPQTVYIPTYDPVAVYTQAAPAGPFVSFGVGFGLGAWSDFGFNWQDGFLCSGGYYNSSFGWSWSYHSWSSSHYRWHRDWRRARPRPPYRPGHGGRFPGWRHYDNRRPDHGRKPEHGNHRPNFIRGETYHPNRDRDREYNRDRTRRNYESHRHNSKENHDRHERRETRQGHRAEHRGGGHRR